MEDTADMVTQGDGEHRHMGATVTRGHGRGRVAKAT